MTPSSQGSEPPGLRGRSGDHQQPVSYTPAGEAVILESGRYDARAAFFRSYDQPNVWVRALEVEAGETLVHNVSFSSGKLLVRAYDTSGTELIGDNVFVYVYAAGERRRPVVSARSSELITLSAGVYDVRGEDTRHEGEVRWLEGIRLKASDIAEHALTF